MRIQIYLEAADLKEIYDLAEEGQRNRVSDARDGVEGAESAEREGALSIAEYQKACLAAGVEL